MTELPPLASDVALTDEREAAMAEIDDFMANRRRQVFVLHGLAGTGKTTRLAHVAEQYRHDAVCCLTGKAASVLREKTALSTGTIHSYFYELLKAEKDEHGRQHLIFAPRQFGGVLSGDVVLVDECSMVPDSIGRQLMYTGAKVLAVGDAGQLPPVKEVGFFREANTALRTIHRQALESPISARSWRSGRAKPTGRTAQNSGSRTRRHLNTVARNLAGRTAPHPEAGEPLLYLKNAPRYRVWNGGIYPGAALYQPGDDAISVAADGRTVTIPRAGFAGMAPGFDDFTFEATTEFDDGYCLTVHKAQSSELPRVLPVDEYRAPQHRKEWLYTGLTRAAQSIVVVPA
jgi:exodeoxyribonuclease-5